MSALMPHPACFDIPFQDQPIGLYIEACLILPGDAVGEHRYRILAHQVAGAPPGGYFSPYGNPRLPDGSEGEYLTERLTNEAISLIDAMSAEATPFFLMMSYYSVHTPLQAPTATVESYNRLFAENGNENSFEEEVFVKINGKQQYLWRAVDQDGEVVDVLLQSKRDGAAAKRFFGCLLRSHGSEPRKIVTDRLRSYGVAHRELIPESIHSTKQYENNRAEQSHEATRVRERGMRRFKSVGQARRFLGGHAVVSNLFNLGRHLVRAQLYRNLRTSAVVEWSKAVA